jgi:hypothetical protein
MLITIFLFLYNIVPSSFAPSPSPVPITITGTRYHHPHPLPSPVSRTLSPPTIHLHIRLTGISIVSDSTSLESCSQPLQPCKPVHCCNLSMESHCLCLTCSLFDASPHFCTPSSHYWLSHLSELTSYRLVSPPPSKPYSTISSLNHLGTCPCVQHSCRPQITSWLNPGMTGYLGSISLLTLIQPNSPLVATSVRTSWCFQDKFC